ncbi:helix-turn-helix domain-containing protein [Rhodospirillum sp. A1_3_36]|uniref:helix-turn-helix domain-containing protein n=1 Tax=Rhodospirillum sp. A1_3_36 TaxID=3391666 RepID=UPI0039A5746B
MTEPNPSPMEETVTIAKATYDAMVDRLEDLEDLLALKEAEKSERLPHAMVKRLLIDGDNPVKVWREHRGLTQSMLSQKSAVRQGYLSEIESGKKTGSVEVYKALARALNVDVDDLIT